MAAYRHLSYKAIVKYTIYIVYAKVAFVPFIFMI